MNIRFLFQSSVLGFGAFAGSVVTSRAAFFSDGISDGCPYCIGGGLFGDIGAVSAVAGTASPADKVSTPPASSAPPLQPIAQPAAVPPPPPVIAGAVGPVLERRERPFPEVKQGADGYWQVSFEHLASFVFRLPKDEAARASGSVEGIPERVRALDGKRVRLSGYMLPTKMESGLVREFLLIRSPMLCCFGIMPAPNDWVIVKMKGKGTAPLMDVPLSFYGTLHVGHLYESKQFAGLYRLDGEKVAAE